MSDLQDLEQALLENLDRVGDTLAGMWSNAYHISPKQAKDVANGGLKNMNITSMIPNAPPGPRVLFHIGPLLPRGFGVLMLSDGTVKPGTPFAGEDFTVLTLPFQLLENPEETIQDLLTGSGLTEPASVGDYTTRELMLMLEQGEVSDKRCAKLAMYAVASVMAQDKELRRQSDIISDRGWLPMFAYARTGKQSAITVMPLCWAAPDDIIAATEAIDSA